MLRLLLAAGADANLRSMAEGLTALHLAAIFGHTEVARVLLEHGTCAAILDDNGHTAAELASSFGQDAFAAVLASVPAAKGSISSTHEDHLQMSSLMKAGTADIMQQGAPAVTPGSMEAGPNLGELQPHDKATSMPVGMQAELQVRPADVLGYATEMQSAADKPGIAQPAGTQHDSPPEEEQLPQPEAANPTEAFAENPIMEAVIEDGHAAELSDDLLQGDPERSAELKTQAPGEGVQQGGPDGAEYAGSRALLHAVRLGNHQKVKRLLRAGCNKEAQDAEGHTPLYLAARGEPACPSLSFKVSMVQIGPDVVVHGTFVVGDFHLTSQRLP